MTRWQVYSAVVLRRLPIILPLRDPIQIKVQQIFDAHEASLSRYSTHELEHSQNLKDKSEGITDLTVGLTAQDREDRWIKEKSEFEFAEFDERLSKTDYLFIQSKFGTDIKDQWLAPQTTFDRKLGDRNLLDTARRALSTSLNINNGYKIISKVPSSVCAFKYPKKIQKMIGYDGAAVFFLKAHLDQPNAEVLDATDDSKNNKLKWMTKDEATLAVDKKYMNGFGKGLLHEDRVDVDEVMRRALRYAATINK